MNQMKAEFDDQEQYIRRDCLEIRWIPIPSAKDDTNQIIKNVGSIVDVPIEDNDISISHRMKSENAVPPIIVKFTPWSFTCQGCSLQSKVEVKEFDYRRHWLGKSRS